MSKIGGKIKMEIYLFCREAKDRENEWEQLVEKCIPVTISVFDNTKTILTTLIFAHIESTIAYV